MSIRSTAFFISVDTGRTVTSTTQTLILTPKDITIVIGTPITISVTSATLAVNPKAATIVFNPRNDHGSFFSF